MPEFRVVPVMREYFHFFGRGHETETPSASYQIECASGKVLVVTEKFGTIEIVLSYCRAAVVDPWSISCIDPFRRASDVACTRSWAKPEKSDIVIYRRVRLHLAAEEPWMKMRS